MGSSSECVGSPALVSSLTLTGGDSLHSGHEEPGDGAMPWARGQSHETVPLRTPAANGVPGVPTALLEPLQTCGLPGPTPQAWYFPRMTLGTQVNTYGDQFIPKPVSGAAPWRNRAGQGRRRGTGHEASGPSLLCPDPHTLMCSLTQKLSKPPVLFFCGGSIMHAQLTASLAIGD